MVDFVAAAFKLLAAVGTKPMISAAQRNDQVVSLLRRLKLDAPTPPPEIGAIYARALVEHCYGKPAGVLELFRDRYVREAFAESFHAHDWTRLRSEVLNAIERNQETREFGHLPYRVGEEVDGFIKVFVHLADLSRTPAEVRLAALFGSLRMAILSPTRRDGQDQQQSRAGLMRSLPDEPPYFTGRQQQLERLTGLFTGAPTAQGPSSRVLLWGYPGVGKTDLALHCAYKLRDYYGDGQLYVDLQGYADESKRLPSQVLADWLVSFWNRARGELPRSESALAEEFRGRLAGKRVLLILDNAADIETILPLLPGTPESAVIVTSRNSLTELRVRGFQSVQVDTLSVDDGADLLGAYLGDAASDRPSLRHLAKYCGGLPLALQIVAGRIMTTGGSPAHLVTQLEDEDKRFGIVGRLPTGNLDVSRLFSWSYKALPADAQRVFRLFGLHPAAGSSTDVYSIAKLANLDEESAHGWLTLLRSRCLISLANERYDTHDLLRAYAKGLIELPEHSGERREAIVRLAEAYYGCVNYAFDSLNKANPIVDLEFLSDWRDRDGAGASVVDAAGGGDQWFAIERPNLMSMVRTASTAVPTLDATAALACSMFYLLEVGGHLDDWAEVERIAESASTASGNIRDVAFSCRNRGRLAMVHILGDYQELLRADDEPLVEQRDASQEAIALLEQAQQLYLAEDIKHERWAQAGWATTVRELADAHRLLVIAAPSRDGAQKSIRLYLAAQNVYQNLGSPNGLASLAQALGQAYVLNDEFDMAEECYREALAFAETPKDDGKLQHPRLKGFTLRRLGDLRRLQGRHQEAAAHYNRCATTFLEDLADPINRARALALSGRSFAAQGDSAAAHCAFDEARKILIERRALRDEDPEVRVIAAWQALEMEQER